MRAKFGIRLVLRKAWKNGHITKQQAKEMLRDDDKLELLADLAGEKVGEDLADDGDGPFLKILKYLMENPEALKALIEIIMSLFAESEVVSPEEVLAG